MIYPTQFDVIVVGGGHAGTEAALAAARMGLAPHRALLSAGQHQRFDAELVQFSQGGLGAGADRIGASDQTGRRAIDATASKVQVWLTGFSASQFQSGVAQCGAPTLTVTDCRSVLIYRARPRRGMRRPA